MKTISKRFLKSGLALLLAFVMLFGTTITGFAAVVDNADTSANVDVAETSETITGGMTFYLDASSWGYSNARFVAYFCNGSTAATWVDATKVSGTTAVYQATVPAGQSHKNIIWVRMPPNTSNDWANKWNQTGDLTYPGDGKYLYRVTGWDNNNDSNNWKYPYSVHSGGHIYFDNSSTNFSDNIYFIIGHDSYSRPYKMNKVANTNNLYYVNLDSFTNHTWSDANYMAIGVSSTNYNADTGYSWGYGSLSQKFTTYSEANHSRYCLDTGKTFQISVANATNGSALTQTYYANYNAFDSTQTAKACYSANGGTSYTEGNTGGNVNVTSYEMSGDGATSASDGASAATSTCTAAKTATVTLTATHANGYKFVGWYTAANGGTQVSTNATYTYTSTGATTYYGRFESDGYSYTVSAGEGGSVSPLGTQSGTTATVVATPSTGYEFDEWVVSSATRTSTSNSGGVETGNFNITANGATIQATFTKKTYSVRFFDGDTQIGTTQTVEHGGSATAPTLPIKEGYTSSWDKAYSNITANTDVNVLYTANDQQITVSADPTVGGSVKINGSTTTPATVKYDSQVTVSATANTGYKFLGWYENGSTLKSESASYTFTCTGDVSLVAKFGPNVYTYETQVTPAGAGTATVNGQTSVTVAYDTNVNFVATAAEGYEFAGWYNGDTQYNANASFNKRASEDITLTAKFNKVWDVTVKVPTGVTQVGFIGDSITSDKTYEDITHGTIVRNFTATTADDYKLIGWSVTSNDTTTTYDDTTIDVEIVGETVITPRVKKLYNITADAVEGSGYHEAGTQVTVKFNVAVDEFIESVTVAPAIDISFDVNRSTNEVTFTMPEQDITLTPVSGKKKAVTFSADVFTSTDNTGYYVPGEAVTINVTPKGGHVITSITSEQTQVTYANNVITFTMPNVDVTLDVEYQASFKAYSETITVHIDRDGPDNNTYNNNEQGGTVTMTCNDAPLAEGGFVDGDVTYTATVNTNYQFVGFFADKDCNRLLTTDTTYTVSPESDITVYALYARKQYIKIVGYSYNDMTYDYQLKAYTFDYTSSNLGTAFNNAFDIRVTYDKSYDTAYSSFNGNLFQVTMNRNAIGRTISWGKAVWNVNAKQANTELPMKLIVKPGSLTQHNKIDVSAQATKIGFDVILSSGRYKIGDANTTILTVGVTGTHTTPGGHNGDNEEYKKIYLSESKTLSWQLEIGADDYSSFTDDQAAGTYVDSFVVYKMRSKTFEIVEPVSLGNNKYQGTALIEEDSYIVPVFFHTEEYCNTNGLVSIELYFDASSIQNLNWGPFVAAYAWGTDDKAYLGEWPGQLLIPTEDGKSFYTKMDVPSVGSTNPAAGVTFNNYLFNTCPTNEQGLFGLGDQSIQTYDYREVITLYEAGYQAITFVAKNSEDGYHGDYNDGSNKSNTISSSTTGIKDKYTFDYLYCRDGVRPMDFTGKPVADTANVKDITNADYYVVSKGDVDIDTDEYSADLQYNGNWSVEWYIFDSTGTHKATVLSTALWHDTNTTDDIHQTVLMTALGLTPETAAGKTVAISYDAANNCPQNNGYKDGKSHQLAYDGQWYGNMLDDSVTGQVIVGLDDGNGNFTLETDDTLNDADYGEAYLKDLEGGTHQTLDIKLDYGFADLTASTKSYTDPVTGVVTNYRFIGWYTQKTDGTYHQISKNLTYSTYINMNETYYAIFREIGELDVVINHLRYVNDDPDIPSHNGVGELSIEVKDKTTGTVVATGPINTSSTTATFPATEGVTYSIKITTKPLMNGEFFAWYTDSYKADGSTTYEEVFTEDGQINSKSTVFAEFEYTYDSTLPDLQKIINIYSDIRRIENKAKLIYSYKNRYGQMVKYTVDNVVLTDDECTGFVGNGMNEYVPAYLTLITFMTPGGEEWSKYFKAEDEEARIAEYEAQEYTFVRSYNKISAYAPKEDVTEVYNGTVKWIVTDTLLEHDKAEVRLLADQGEPIYTITYETPEGEKSKQGLYNTLLYINAPALDANGKEFSYWQDKDTNEILTYTTHYNYRLTENRNIVAVYGKSDLPEWTPTIEYVTYTREFSDNKDVIYTDYHLAYTSRGGKVLNDVKGTEDIQYGLLLLRDAAFYNDGTNTEYPDVTDAAIKAELETVAKSGNSMAFTVNNTKYNCYCYDLTSLSLTNFNRCDYFRSYDNNKVVGGSHYYREYTFTAVAYMIVNDEVILSNPKNVDFFELGNETTTKQTN